MSNVIDPETGKVFLTEEECAERASNIFQTHVERSERVYVYALPRGGSCALLNYLCLRPHQNRIRPVGNPLFSDLIFDDVIDSGETRARFECYGKHFVALVNKQIEWPNYPKIPWVVFPWEKEQAPESAVTRLIQHIGEDANRAGLKDTPKRVVKALSEMTAGYGESPSEILSRQFEESCDEMVISRNIPFVSLCEHHMLPFTGTVDIGYIPKAKVVGLSKLSRLVDCFSRRLQVQERMTKEIALSIQKYLETMGVAVVVRAQHSCQACRGVKKHNTEMVTSSMLGVFREKPEARAEFLALCK